MLKKISKNDEYWFYGFICLVIVCVGVLFNAIATSTNDCKMPVKTTKEIQSNCWSSFEDYSEVKFGYLGDIFIIKILGKTRYFSVGDIFLILGGTSYILGSVLYIIKINRKK
jgi:predicted membrane channel-forming protein YqfA (hemolysin III family)